MEKPKLLIVAGPNGSGKTSVTGKILKHEWIEGTRRMVAAFDSRLTRGPQIPALRWAPEPIRFAG